MTTPSKWRAWSLCALLGWMGIAGGCRARTEEPPADADGWRARWQEVPRWGGRVGYVDAKHDLQVRLVYDEGSPWVTVAHDVRDFQLLDWRLAIRKRDDSLWVIEGPLNGPMKKVADRVAAYQLTLNRLGLLAADGTFSVAEWGHEPAPLATGVKAFQVNSRRMGILGFDGSFWLHQPGPEDTFEQIAKGVESFQLERDYVAYAQGGQLFVARAGFNEELVFKPQADAARDFAMEVTVEIGKPTPPKVHLAVVDAAGALLVGEGDETAIPLKRVTTVVPVREVHWAGRQLAAIGVDDKLQLAPLDDEGRLGGLREVGVVAGIRMAPEATLVAGREGSLSLARSVTPAAEAASPEANAIRAQPFALRSELVPAGALSYDISSLRPPATRRMVTAAALSGASGEVRLTPRNVPRSMLALDTTPINKSQITNIAGEK